jgi:Uma2 family endonuclease
LLLKQILDISQLDLNGTYSYADYLTWRFNERVELLKGKLFRMSPAPSSKHQSVSSNILRLLFKHFEEGHPCRVFHAPFDVRLLDSRKTVKKKDSEVSTVVQPDISVICDLSKMDERGCFGAPDWIIEILSIGTAKRDLIEKKRLYEENGVQEYWIIHPFEEFVQVYTLGENGRFGEEKVYELTETASSHVFPDLKIRLQKLFD